ncbi:MAG TPA: serine hydrolase [Flavipsychrobacter sp.]|nr:serine hydrolase [Flavipsychrobacter sp.]
MKNTLKKIVLMLVVIQNTSPLFAQKTPIASEPDISRIVDTLLYGHENGFITNPSVVGAAVGVYWKGKTYYSGYGMADRERKIKVDFNTLFEIGSNTKIFTGLMLAGEMAERKMSGNDFIEKYVAVNKNIQGKVRLTDMANHISGLPTFHDSASLAELISKDTTKDPLMLVTDDYMLSVLKKVDTLHQYGEYEYSNFGVGMLGYILQKEEHATYEQLLQRMICKPLGLKNTTTISDTNARNMAKGYYKETRAPFIHLCSAMQGAGGIKSSIIDMMSFVKAQITEAGPLQKALSISHKKYYNEENLQIAMGWHIGKTYNTEIYEMRGDTYGASSLMLFNKEHDLGIVILLNSANSGVVNRSMNTILAKLLDTSGSQHKFSQPEVMVDRKTLESYVGIYELQPGFDASVSIEEDGKLAIQLTGQPKLAFKAVENNWFVLEKFNCQLEFIKDGKGICNEFNLYQNAQKINCKRKS